MSEKILDEFTWAGTCYCVTQDNSRSTRSPQCIRLHIQKKDSLGGLYWSQVLCTHPNSESAMNVIHAMAERLLQLSKVVKQLMEGKEDMKNEDKI